MPTAEPLRVLVVDDEPLARAGVVDLLAGDPEIVLAGEAANGAAAVEAIRALTPDLVLLDVQMPELDGFGVIREIGAEAMPTVIFVTAYDQYAVAAFEVHALDYLLKPFEDARFHEALGRAKRAVRQGRVTDLSRRLADLLADGPVGSVDETAPSIHRLVVKHGNTTHFVAVEEIDWIEAADYCVRIHAGGRRHVLRESMTSLERRLDPRRFYRVHRSAIVNLERVKEVQPFFQGDHVLLLRNGAKLKLSRNRKAGLESAMRGG